MEQASDDRKPVGWPSRLTKARLHFVTGKGGTGKSTIALGILHRLAATVARVGVFRPITRGDAESRDYILELLLDHTTAGLSYDDCVGVTYHQLHDDPEAALGEIVDRYHRVADRCDAVLVVGSDYTDVAAPSELSVNARIAANLGAPVVLAVKGKGRTPEQVAQVVEVCVDEIAAQHAYTAAAVANRCDPAQLAEVREALEKIGQRSYVLPEEPLLVAPSVAELQAAVEDAFPDAELRAWVENGPCEFDLRLADMPRPFKAHELSDGTLKYICLLAVFMGYRLPPFIVLNEPEASLHPSLLAPLARLIAKASRRADIWIVTHSDHLMEALRSESSVPLRRVVKVKGATAIEGLSAGGEFRDGEDDGDNDDDE